MQGLPSGEDELTNTQHTSELSRQAERQHRGDTTVFVEKHGIPWPGVGGDTLENCRRLLLVFHPAS